MRALPVTTALLRIAVEFHDRAIARRLRAAGYADAARWLEAQIPQAADDPECADVGADVGTPDSDDPQTCPTRIQETP